MVILELVAILSCAIFAGAAIYINAAEHPARLECGTELAVRVFGPSYRRAAVMQASLALVATFSGTAVAIGSGNPLWYLGAALIFFVVPFTFIAVMPTNRRLLDPTRDHGTQETDALLRKWGRLHAMRSLTSTAAAIVYIYLGISG